MSLSPARDRWCVRGHHLCVLERDGTAVGALVERPDTVTVWEVRAASPSSWVATWPLLATCATRRDAAMRLHAHAAGVTRVA